MHLEFQVSIYSSFSLFINVQNLEICLSKMDLAPSLWNPLRPASPKGDKGDFWDFA